MSSGPASPPDDAAGRLYRLLLLAYPRSFRRAYGDGMARLFRWRLGRARERGGRATLRFWGFVLRDLLATAVPERIEVLTGWRRSTGPSAGPSRSPGSRSRGARSPGSRSPFASAPEAASGSPSVSGSSAAPGSGPSHLPPPRRLVPGRRPDLVDSLWQDLKHATRRLAQAPGFTVLAVFIVALGIGANAAIFGVVDAFLFRSLPVEDPGTLVHVYQDSDDGDPSSSSYPAYRDMTQQTEVFSGATAVMSGFSASWARESGTAQPVAAAWITASYFDVLGIRPHLGRAFPAEVDHPGSESVGMVSHRTWQRELGADPDVLGRVLRINGAPVTVVAVGPPGFGGIVSGHQVDVWMSISSLGPVIGAFAEGTLERRADHWFDVVARLQPGVEVGRAQAAMDLLAARLAREYPEYNEGRDITVFSASAVRIHPDVDSDLYPAGGVLMGVVGLVLLIACSNLANLLLAQGSARGREVAVRQAVGATRGRLVRHLLTESVLLAVLGGLLGVAVAAGIVRLLTVYQPPLPLPVNLSLTVDSRVFVFALALSILTGLAFGLIPALRGTRPDLVASLKDPDEAMVKRRTGRWPGWLGFRSLLVVGQVAGSLVLLAGAGLLVRSLGNAQQVDLGFPADGLAILEADAGQAGYEADRAEQIFDELAQRVAALPGVEAVTRTSRLPVTPGGSSTLVVEEYEARTGTSAIEVEYAAVEPGYFQTMRIPLLHGRAFVDADRDSGDPVAVISEEMARRYWGRPDVVGRRYRSQGAPDSWVRIVGVVDDVDVEQVGEEPTPVFYRPLPRGAYTGLITVARTTRSPAALVGMMRAELRQIDDQVPVIEAGTMADHVSEALALPRAAAGTLAVLAGVAVLLACMGLYGIVAFAVSRRTAEVGIRMALGARGRQVVTMLVKEVMALVGAGLALGLVLSMLVTPVLEGLLYGVAPTDPVTLASVAALLAGVALAATWIPARRAARTDPMMALRNE